MLQSKKETHPFCEKTLREPTKRQIRCHSCNVSSSSPISSVSANFFSLSSWEYHRERGVLTLVVLRGGLSSNFLRANLRRSLHPLRGFVVPITSRRDRTRVLPLRRPETLFGSNPDWRCRGTVLSFPYHHPLPVQLVRIVTRTRGPRSIHRLRYVFSFVSVTVPVSRRLRIPISFLVSEGGVFEYHLLCLGY